MSEQPEPRPVTQAPATTSRPDADTASAAAARRDTDAASAAAARAHVTLWARIRSLVRAIEENDDAKIEEAVVRLSRSRRWLAPLALAVGAFALLFDGLRLLVSNWRLTLVQILPAMWIWLAMFDLKIHVLHGKSFHALRGPILIPIVLAIVAITIACFFLNAVFAFAIARSRKPEIRPAVKQAKSHLGAIFLWGGAVGLALACSTSIVTRWGRPWFTLTLGAVIGVMMICYVAVPARLIGVKTKRSTRDKLWVTAVGGTISALVCTPPYLLGRVGILMLGSKALFIPGIVVIAVGVTLQAGANGAVRAIKMSTKLTVTGASDPEPAPPPEQEPAPPPGPVSAPPA